MSRIDYRTFTVRVNQSPTLDTLDALCDEITQDATAKELCNSVLGRRVLAAVEVRRMALGDSRFVDVGVN